MKEFFHLLYRLILSSAPDLPIGIEVEILTPQISPIPFVMEQDQAGIQVDNSIVQVKSDFHGCIF
jgi:hypothetical protein